MQFNERDSIAVSVWSSPYHVGKKYEIGDILCFPDEDMLRIQANNVSGSKCKVTEQDACKAQAEHPDYNRNQLASLLGCSE